MPGSNGKMKAAVLSGVSSKLPLCCPILFHSLINVDIKVVLLDVVYVLVYFVTLLSSKKDTGPVESMVWEERTVFKNYRKGKEKKGNINWSGLNTVNLVSMQDENQMKGSCFTQQMSSTQTAQKNPWACW